MKPSPLDDAALLAALKGSAHRPLHVSEVSAALGLSMAARRQLSDALEALVARGLVTSMPGSRYRLPRQSTGTRIEGLFSQHPRGFAFVAANDGGDDVFIPATSILGAMQGDLVAALAQPGPRGREGVVIEVLARRSTKVPGTLRVRTHHTWVEPDDARVRGPIPVGEQSVAGDGDTVLCEITRWPEHPGETPQGEVIENLGKPGELVVEERKVLLREGVEEAFPEGAMAEALRLPREVTDAERAGREDLRHLPLVTIDPEDARDHDDAVHVARREDGGYVATVAIADVSHYVTPGSALDAAAFARGTSVYLPDRAVPMLPPALSSHLASLIPHEDRLVLGVEAHLSPDGEVESTRLFEGVICSRASLTYTQVAHGLGWVKDPLDKVPPPLPHELREDIEVAADLAGVLRKRRLKRGALDFDLPEGRVRFADDGRTPEDIYQSRHDPGVRRAYQLIEEMMLLANEAAARTCVERDVPTVFRVHGQPDEELLARFATVAEAYGHKLDIEAGRVPKKLAALLRKVQGKPEARVLGMLLLRAMPQARYSSQNTGHFGLASEAYLHFTSPIRRYPDIVAHRAARLILRREKIARDDGARAANGRAAAESSRLERRAMDVEREVMDLYRCVVALKHVGEIHTGTITGLSAQGPYLDIERPFVSGLLRVSLVTQDEWEIDELGIQATHGRSGLRYSLGDTVTVEVADASMLKRAVYFTLPAEAREALLKQPRRKTKEKDKRYDKDKKRGAHGRSKKRR
jgi:ribonuclease R